MFIYITMHIKYYFTRLENIELKEISDEIPENYIEDH
jgi:hypothetical protein